ncbi:MAG: apolipoprotein N-acyltransferase [Proteobacteria bacterium]|nr:apolipoprotein N-acyltransferase [Pseudomonadota bacterium]MBS0553369.1 apolipoprotein N-acyltransferase [Pseudomonadota bacterium]
MSRPVLKPLSGNLRLHALALVGGVATSFAHAPHGAWYLAPLSGLALTRIADRAPVPAAALVAGGLFGVGLHGATLGWLFAGIAASDALLRAHALPSVLILAFSAAPALIAWIAMSAWHRGTSSLAVAGLLIPGLWTLGEWARHFSRFHFPWGQLGYTQAPGSPLSALFPVVGALGLSFVVVMLGGLLALLSLRHARPEWPAAVAAIAALVGLGLASTAIEWTRPVLQPIRVRLLQGNFPATDKFDRAQVVRALDQYRSALLASDAPVTVLPETALPLLEHQLPEAYIASLERAATEEKRDLLISFFRPSGLDKGGYFNSARVIGVSGAQTRDKRFLVPFGEYLPATGLLGLLPDRPTGTHMTDTVPGFLEQDSIVLGGVRVALKLCFEDLFASALRSEDAAAGYLVVISNDSWEGSDAPMHQHLQVAQARAAEAGKPLLRVANTGWSASIDHRGRIVAAAPPNRPAVLDAAVQPREGVTPYTRYGDAIPVGFAALAAVLAALGVGPASRGSATRIVERT